MAKEKKGKSAGRIAMEAAKRLTADAKNDVQKKHAADATEKAKAMLRHESAEKFKELASARVSKALASIAGVGKLANPRAYAFDQLQIDKIEKALVEEVGAVAKRYKSALSGKAGPAAGGFSL